MEYKTNNQKYIYMYKYIILHYFIHRKINLKGVVFAWVCEADGSSIQEQSYSRWVWIVDV